jgi:hypothetical protein
MRLLFTVSLALLALAGCRTSPYVNAHIESVNAEYRQLEDYVYSLEEENSRLQQENDELKRLSSGTPAAGVGRPDAGRGPVPRSRPRPLPGTSQGTLPPRAAPDAKEGPTIEIPETVTPPARMPGAKSTLQRPRLDRHERPAPADTPPTIEIPTIEIPVSAGKKDGQPASFEASSAPADIRITHLLLHPLTGGADFDGQPGDDGLQVVFEPRNAAEEYVAQAGPLSIVVLDPSRQGEAARVARWDFDLSAARQLLASSSPGRGIKVDLPWPAAAPLTSRLQLFVRYETPDGRRLQTAREIVITPPGQAASRWTPRSR